MDWCAVYQQKEHIFLCPAILSKSLCVSEIGGGGEILSFSIRLLFPSLTDGDSSGERDLVLWNAIEYSQVFVLQAASRAMHGTLACDIV